MPESTVLLPFQPLSMSTAQLAAVSFLARYSGRTHEKCTAQLKRWFAWWSPSPSIGGTRSSNRSSPT